jgi:hypothetical protein
MKTIYIKRCAAYDEYRVPGINGTEAQAEHFAST